MTKKPKTIKPQTLKGFRDFLPEEMVLRQKVIAVFQKTFEKYGYQPLETPALEYAEVLLGKYGDEAEKLVYQFKDRGGRNIALKYDLTVPACRVLAQYDQQLTLPFKRYQIQPVWRAENPQRGRFREFLQCDADVFGSKSLLADAEYLQMGIEVLEQLKFGELDFVVEVNSRKFLEAYLVDNKLPSAKRIFAMIIIDKLDKIGEGNVIDELIEKLKLPPDQAEEIVQNLTIDCKTFEEYCNFYKKCDKLPSVLPRILALKKIFDYLKNVGIKSERYTFKPSLSRGLAYYTGPIWEFFVKKANIGSLGGGGRYDKLISLYTGKDVPATGGSFGIERIIEVIKENNLLPTISPTSTQVLVTVFSPEYLEKSIEVATILRSSNKVNTELYLDPEAKLDKQLKYADRKGIPFVVILGPEEVEKNQVTLKNLQKRTQKQISMKQFVTEINRNL